MRILIVLIAGAALALSSEEPVDKDGEESRKILGSSVVTSVSVIMDTGNGSKAVYTDAVGKPVPKPSSASELASPINLLNPDRYEFYTFDDNGDLIKRLMSLEEIQGIIATGDSDGFDLDSFTSLGYLPEKRVNDVVNNVQNVLKEEMETHKNQPDTKPMFDTPDVSDSWSMILPAVFGNSGEDIKPEKPIIHVTPDTIMIEPNANLMSTSEKVDTVALTTNRPSQETDATSPKPLTSASTPRSTTKHQFPSERPTVISTSAQMSTIDKLITLHTDTTNKTPLLTPIMETQTNPMIKVDIFSNSKSTEKPLDQLGMENSAVVDIKPPDTIKSGLTPVYGTKITTKNPLITADVTVSPINLSTQEESVTQSTPVQTDAATQSAATFMTFIPSSLGSTLPTTKVSAKPLKTTYVPLTTPELTTKAPTTVNIPLLTEYKTEATTSIWNIKSTTPITTASPAMEEIPLTTKSKPTAVDTTQELITKSEYPQSDLPTLAELLNLNKNTDIEQGEQPVAVSISETTPSSLTFSILNDEQNKEDVTTTELTSSYTKLAEKSEEDLSTLSSEYFGSKNNLPTTHQITETTTQLPIDQSTNTAQKLSATELLDQLLFTTNIYEINTELAEKTAEQQTFGNEDERFESSTQEESMLSEVKTAIPTTTEPFLIKINDNTEQYTTDKTFINSIEQLLSQAVGNVEEDVININNTEKIENMLINSGKKNMTEIQIESATVASEIVGIYSNTNEENEKTTTETITLDSAGDNDASILSESVGSLLSQIYDSDQPIYDSDQLSHDSRQPSYDSDQSNLTASENATSTDNYPTATNTTQKTEGISLVANVFSTEKYELETAANEDTEKYDNFLKDQGSTVTADSTTVNYIPLIPTTSDYTPHLINITILSPEDAKINAKDDMTPSISEVINEETKQNVALSSNEPTEIYIEKIAATEKSNEKLSTTNNSNEILKTEETIYGLYNDSLVNKNVQNQSQNIDSLTESISLDHVLENVTEISTEDELTEATTSSFVAVKETPKISDRPTTIIIIKRTERPQIQDTTTITPIKQDESTEVNIGTTTVVYENLESTTYTKQDVEATEDVTNKMLQISTDPSQEDIGTETTTENIKEGEPSIEIIIRENNKLSSESAEHHASHIHPIYTETPDVPNDGKQEVESSENKEPQETSSINAKISNIISPHKRKENIANSLNKNLQNEKVNKSDISGDKKPESTWTLVPTIAPHSDQRVVQNYSPPIQHFPEIIEPTAPIDLVAKPLQGFGLEDSTSRLDTDIYQFAQLCNELAFGFWKTITSGISSARSVFVSPFGATSLLAMVFLGARGATSGEMNEILKLDDMVTFNPHLIFKNVSESIRADETDSGVSSSAIIRELFSDRSKGKLLPFYKERAKAFYDGYVEEVSFREIGDVIRRRTNLQVKKYTNGKMAEFLRDGSIITRPPLAGVSVNIFQTDCSQASTDGRDGELHFVVLPSIRQRRLIPVPAVVYKSGFLAGYEPSLDATAVSLGTKDQVVSTIFVIPGQQGIATPGDGLARLEKRLVESSFKKGAWSRLLRSLIPRPGLEVQIPRFSHKSVINATVTLKKMGLHDLFDVEKADLRGLNGVANELYLSDMLQINSFATCGEKRITDAHHSEIYPASATRAHNARYLENYQSEDTYYRSDLLEEPRDYQRAFHDPLHDPTYLSLPLSLRPRQARVPESPRLKFDRPFIYFIRHNPTGLILHMGRFNPRLLP